MKTMKGYLDTEQLRTIDADAHSESDLIPTAALQAAVQAPFYLTLAADVEPLVPRRTPFSHKGSYGRVLLAAGKRGMAGASILAARAALRSGSGLVTVHLPGCNLPIVQTALPEAIAQCDDREDCISHIPLTQPFSAIAAGPGMGCDEKTAEALHTLIREAAAPLILDADALNMLAAHPAWLAELPQGCILTPHPAEWARVAGSTPNATSRLLSALTFAVEHGVYIVLKGHFTVVVTPQGECHFNTTGNGGMATAGSGDVLTGILLSLVGQGLSPLDGCRAAVYVHALAGDLKAAELSGISLMASDIVEGLPAAWKRLSGEE